jgi:hypothetical protein
MSYQAKLAITTDGVIVVGTIRNGGGSSGVSFLDSQGAILAQQSTEDVRPRPLALPNGEIVVPSQEDKTLYFLRLLRLP